MPLLPNGLWQLRQSDQYLHRVLSGFVGGTIGLGVVQIGSQTGLTPVGAANTVNTSGVTGLKATNVAPGGPTLTSCFLQKQPSNGLLAGVISFNSLDLTKAILWAGPSGSFDDSFDLPEFRVSYGRRQISFIVTDLGQTRDTLLLTGPISFLYFWVNTSVYADVSVRDNATPVLLG